MKQYIKAQIEWIKLFFVEDKTPNTPSHKNLIGIALTTVFCIAFLKKTVLVAGLVDIPPMWAALFLGLLAIRGGLAYLEKRDANGKSNGNGNGNGASNNQVEAPQ